MQRAGVAVRGTDVTCTGTDAPGVRDTVKEAFDEIAMVKVWMDLKGLWSGSTYAFAIKSNRIRTTGTMCSVDVEAISADFQATLSNLNTIDGPFHSPSGSVNTI